MQTDKEYEQSYNSLITTSLCDVKDDRKVRSLTLEFEDCSEVQFNLISKVLKQFVKKSGVEKMSPNQLIVLNFEKNKIDYNFSNNVATGSEIGKIKSDLRRQLRAESNREKTEFETHILEMKKEGNILDLSNDSLVVGLSKKSNTLFGDERSVAGNLERLIEIKGKISQSLKEVNKVIHKEDNYEEFVKLIKEKGFILSYAGCLKLALRKGLNTKDLLRPTFGSSSIDEVKASAISPKCVDPITIPIDQKESAIGHPLFKQALSTVLSLRKPG